MNMKVLEKHDNSHLRIIENIKKGDNNYPKMLENIKNKPQELYVEGNLDILNMPSITIVGSRNMTDYGRDITKKIVKELTLAGICIVSGLAIGIDSVAHQTCLDYGGKTVAVLGCGLNKIYPKENKKLYKDIIENGGCAISEYEPDSEANKINFPARNRIVSGLSLATVVVEATYRSGTSITAKFAFEQGKKVFCIPNSIGNKNSSGTINLIKKGAIMITTGEGILYEIGLIDKIDKYGELLEKQRLNKIDMIEQEELSKLDKQTQEIYLYIKENKIVSAEAICNDLRMDIKNVNVYLTILELKGLILNKCGNSYVLRDELYV